MKDFEILSFKYNEQIELWAYVYVPQNISIEKLPLIVFLHGAGERGNGKESLEKLKLVGIPKYLSKGQDYPAIILMPQCPCNFVWNNLVLPLKGLIDKTVMDYNIDQSKVSITGLSMGGYGTWEMGLTYPNLFSAMAPICGGGLSWRAGRLKNMPIWAFHGDADNIVPLQNSIEMVDAVNKTGGKARLTILHNVAHNSWDEAYNHSTVMKWLISQKNAD